MGEASKFWLHNTLKSLNKSLNNNLSLYNGDPIKILLQLCDKFEIN